VQTSWPYHGKTCAFDSSTYISRGNLEEIDVRSKDVEQFSILLLPSEMSRKEWLRQTAHLPRHWNHLGESILLCGIRK
jgi:hypothetical protein